MTAAPKAIKTPGTLKKDKRVGGIQWGAESDQPAVPPPASPAAADGPVKEAPPLLLTVPVISAVPEGASRKAMAKEMFKTMSERKRARAHTL
jgi:hypothetical protein